jgi:hypothetical protein
MGSENSFAKLPDDRLNRPDIPAEFQDLKGPRVHLTVDPEVIDISIGTNIGFSVHVLPGRILKPWIRTASYDGTCHVYFKKEGRRAHELFARAVKYFDSFGKLKAVRFDWGRPVTSHPSDRSDNYTEYIKARDALRAAIPLEEAQKKAVEATWTYGVAKANGFEIVSVKEEGDPDNPSSVLGLIERT